MTAPTLTVAPESAGTPPDGVGDVLDAVGLELDGWQQDFLYRALSRDSGGLWSAFEVGLVVPRQNGKNIVLAARQLAGLFVFGERLQVHSAHDFKTAQEHHRLMAELIEGSAELAARMKKIRWAHGSEAIELRSGERLRFLARSRASGRGFSADTVYFDEAFQLDSETVGAVLPTLSARPNSQVWFASSAPHKDSEHLHGLLARADTGEAGRLLLAEWGNTDEVALDDREAWRRANPALGVRISEEHVMSELEALAETARGQAEFARERLGVREQLGSADWSFVSDEEWQAVTW